jgi:hypothetical protein
VSPLTVADKGCGTAMKSLRFRFQCGQLPSCRRAAYLARKANRPHPVTLLAADLSHVHVREFLRREIRKRLQQAGLVSAPEMPPRRGSNLNLRRVGPEDPRE